MEKSSKLKKIMDSRLTRTSLRCKNGQATNCTRHQTTCRGSLCRCKTQRTFITWLFTTRVCSKANNSYKGRMIANMWLNRKDRVCITHKPMQDNTPYTVVNLNRCRDRVSSTRNPMPVMDSYITRTSLRRRRKDCTATGTETNGIHQSILCRDLRPCKPPIPFKMLRSKTMVCSKVNLSRKRTDMVCITHKPMLDSTPYTEVDPNTCKDKICSTHKPMPDNTPYTLVISNIVASNRPRVSCRVFMALSTQTRDSCRPQWGSPGWRKDMLLLFWQALL